MFSLTGYTGNWIIHCMPMEDEDFRCLYESYSGFIMAYLRKLTGDSEVASELLQETFLKYYSAFDRLNVTNEKSYLYKMAYHFYVGWLKKHTKEKNNTDLENIVIADSSDDQQKAEWQDLRSKILIRLAVIHSEYPSIFMLRIDEGFKFDDIAHITGKSERTVRRIFQKIKSVIKTEFGDFF